jgi:hypothetical protein
VICRSFLLYLHGGENLIIQKILSHETLKKLFTVQKQFFHSFHGCPAFLGGAFFCDARPASVDDRKFAPAVTDLNKASLP